MSMKLFPAIGLAILSFCSCSGDNKIKDEMERFYGQRVVLPLDSMLYVADDIPDMCRTLQQIGIG